MRVIVTRPEGEAQQWVHELQAHGWPAVSLPLIAIEPLADATALRQAVERLADYHAAMFVSRNAVDAFFKANRAVAGVPWTWGAIKTRAWAPGPATAAALLQEGVAPGLIDGPAPDAPQFDSESLWRQVAGQAPAGGRVLIVRGGDGTDTLGTGREWLAAQLAGQGVAVDTVVSYRRLRARWTPAQLRLASAAAQDGSAWLFSSSESIAHLAALLPGQAWTGSRAVATHPRIAQAAREVGFGVVCASRPSVEAVAAALESIR